MVFRINSQYDAGGEGAGPETTAAEDQYRKLQQRIMTFKKERQSNDYQELCGAIQPGRVGIRMPARNAFDFIERPQMDIKDYGDSGESQSMHAGGSGGVQGMGSGRAADRLK